MKRSAAVLMMWALAAGPLAAAEKQPVADYLSDALLRPSMTCPSYVPGRSTSLDPPVSAFEADWYVQTWRGLGEPSLYQASLSPVGQRRHSYRITWIRSFEPTILVRLDEQTGGRMRMTARRPSFDPDGPGNHIDRMLTVTETAKFRRALRLSAIFQAAAADCPRLGTDGAQWIFDANDAGTYRFAHRWSPGGGPVFDVGLTMLKLTGWPLDPIY